VGLDVLMELVISLAVAGILIVFCGYLIVRLASYAIMKSMADIKNQIKEEQKCRQQQQKLKH
jgi:hypothetical protein